MLQWRGFGNSTKGWRIYEFSMNFWNFAIEAGLMMTMGRLEWIGIQIMVQLGQGQTRACRSVPSKSEIGIGLIELGSSLGPCFESHLGFRSDLAAISKLAQATFSSCNQWA